MSQKFSPVTLVLLLLLPLGFVPAQVEEERPLLPAFDGKHVGFIDDTGQVVIPFQYDDAEPFSEGLAAVLYKDKFGYVDRQGHWAIPPAFVGASRFSEGLAAVEKFVPDTGMRRGYINKKGEVVIPFQFLEAEPFSQGLAVVSVRVREQKGIRYGYIDKSGNYVVVPRFVYAKPFSEGLAAVKEKRENGSTHGGYIDHKGSFVISGVYDYVCSFSEGLACAYWNRKYGYIDKSGKVVIDFGFGEAREFVDGKAKVRIGATWAFIDKTGHFLMGDYVTGPEYWEASAFSNGVAAVYKPGGESGLIDRRGMQLVYYPLDRAEVVGRGVFLIRHSVFGWLGYMNSEGKIIYRFPSGSRCRYCLFFVEDSVKPEKIRLSSEPPGAIIYVIPRWDFDSIPSLLSNPEELEKFKFPWGLTNVECKSGCVLRQVYWVVFSLRDKKSQKDLQCKVLVDILQGRDHEAFVDFGNCLDLSGATQRK